ncbi:MAG: ribonuclease Z [Flavobacteriaceae bacterium]|nr:ribonuclease Z [Flavobacteriaceae bacterium]
MKIERIDKLTIIKPSENSISKFFLVFKEKYSNFKRENLILDFSDFKGVKTENILLFLQIAKGHKHNGMSFVIISNEINPDDLPDTLMAVPTLTEAQDIIEMEEIERDLGF